MTSISYLGPPGTWSEVAARCFVKGATLIPKSSFRELIDDTINWKSDLCVVPLENSVEGPVTQVLDMLLDSNIRIMSEKIIRIRHCLLSDSSEINVIYSHPQAISQCRNTLTRLYPGASLLPVNSTASKAQEAAKERGVAVVGTPNLSSMYKLKIINHNVCDFDPNLTRFVMLGRDDAGKSGSDKTTMSFLLKDYGPGSLVRALSLFSTRNINLSMVFSRPEKHNPGIYRFFIDAFGHTSDPELSEAIEELRAICSELTVLGSYKRSDWENPESCEDSYK